jgi:hypothetical protein
MRLPRAKITVEWIDITNRHVTAFVVMAAVAFVLAKRWFRGSSVFGFESPYWDLGLIPTLAALEICVIRWNGCNGTRRRFLLGFVVFGLAAVTAYIVSCSRPARWSPVSALLPFQTGFRLAPEIGARWTDLSFWKIVVDTTVLASLPLIVASVGGTMCSVRFTMRRIVVAVAVIAMVLGVLVNFGRRVRRFDDLAIYHRSQIVGVPMREVIDSDGLIIRLEPSPVDIEGRKVTTRQRLLNQWYANMFKKYLCAARHPWFDVPPEPQPCE